MLFRIFFHFEPIRDAADARVALQFFIALNIEKLYTAHPVAQLVQRWTPGGESPGSRRFGARCMQGLYETLDWNGPVG